MRAGPGAGTPREGAPRPPRCHWPGSPGAGEGGGGGAPLVGLAGQSLEAPEVGVGEQAGGRACGAAERAASRAAGPSPERPGTSAGLESERTSKHHPRPSAAFGLLRRRAGERARASPARPPLGLRAGTPRATDLPHRVRAQPLPVVQNSHDPLQQGPFLRALRRS